MLSATQIEQRKGRLTASRIACLMRGDAPAVLRLYRELIGEEVEEDLSHVWAVQLGAATEQLNLDWYERKNNAIACRGEVMLHPLFAWAACTLDGWDVVLNCPVECKHVGGREPIEVIVDRYQPQLQWQMECTSASECALSVIMGASEPVVEYIARDEAYAGEMLKRGEQFMECVRTKTPPLVLDAVPPPPDAAQRYDMTGDNRWADSAVTWLTTRQAASDNHDAATLLKSMVPSDAKQCSGHGVRITRDRAGRLSLREMS